MARRRGHVINKTRSDVLELDFADGRYSALSNGPTDTSGVVTSVSQSDRLAVCMWLLKHRRHSQQVCNDSQLTRYAVDCWRRSRLRL